MSTRYQYNRVYSCTQFTGSNYADLGISQRSAYSSDVNYYYQKDYAEIPVNINDWMCTDQFGVVTIVSNADFILYFSLYLPVTTYQYETPSGTIDGANLVFTLAHTPSPVTSLILTKNGMIMNPGGNDYTLSGATITFVAGAVPLTGDTLLAVSYTA